jgi:hypothetical protein
MKRSNVIVFLAVGGGQAQTGLRTARSKGCRRTTAGDLKFDWQCQPSITNYEADFKCTGCCRFPVDEEGSITPVVQPPISHLLDFCGI